ncbi:FAD-binding oxidoreductase, partial [Chloroflexota bacterium]
KNASVEFQDEETAPIKPLHDELVDILGSDNVLAEPQQLTAYQIDGKQPTVVAFPANTGQVCQVVRAANRHSVPVTPWGKGSKQATGLPLERVGIILSLENMNRIMEIDAPNLTARVEAGMSLAELQKELSRQGLYFPLEPVDMDSATAGGTLAANSSGPQRLLYGTARDLVLGVTVVTPRGEVIRAGGKTMKNVAGYDLRKLFLGSWGTLGVITEAVLRLYYPPEEHSTLVVKFSDIENVSGLVASILNSFLRPESIELIDATSARSPDSAIDIGEDELLLLVGLSGSKEMVERHISEIQALAKANHAETVNVVSDAEEEKVWASHRCVQLSRSVPGAVGGKAVVPVDRTGDMFREIQEAAARHRVTAGVTGRMGNGILYPAISAGKRTPEGGLAAAITELAQSAERLGGFFLMENGPAEIRGSYDPVSRRSDYELMRNLKRTLDPQRIFNPGKVVRTS